jgi:hypothetical protein
VNFRLLLSSHHLLLSRDDCVNVCVDFFAFRETLNEDLLDVLVQLMLVVEWNALVGQVDFIVASFDSGNFVIAAVNRLNFVEFEVL